MPSRKTCVADPFAPGAIADPYPSLARLRAESPVAWHPRGMWIVTPYADVSTLLRDRRYEHWRGVHAGTGARPPFTTLRSLKETVEARATDILRPLVARTSRFELMRDFAHPLTFAIAAELCGIPEDDVEPLGALVSALDWNVLLALEPARLPDEKRDAAEALRKRLRLDERIVATLVVLYAGHRNMMNAIGNSLLALARHPDVLADLRRAPRLLESGVHELLRYDSPLQYISIVAREPANIGGQCIAAGEQILLAIGAANRDPAAFAAPATLNLRRHPNEHLSFGTGSLRCPGSSTAVIELAAALRMLLSMLPSFRIEEPVEWCSDPYAQRGPAALWLNLGDA